MAKTLAECETNGFILHGLVQALTELDGSTTPQAREGTGALVATIERLSEELSRDISDLADTIGRGVGA